MVRKVDPRLLYAGANKYLFTSTEFVEICFPHGNVEWQVHFTIHIIDVVTREIPVATGKA